MKGQVLHIFNILKNSISRILNIEICKTGNSIIINFGMTHLIVHNQNSTHILPLPPFYERLMQISVIN